MQVTCRLTFDQLCQSFNLKLSLLFFLFLLLSLDLFFGMFLVSHEKTSIWFFKVVEEEGPKNALDGYHLEREKIEDRIGNRYIVGDQQERSDVDEVWDYEKPVDHNLPVEFFD